MSGIPKVSSVHMSGATLSYLLSAACATEEASKYLFVLYGHYDTHTEVTDVADSADVFDVIVVGAVPVNTKFRGQADPVGLLSISKSVCHKLSFQDTAFVTGGGEINYGKPGRESDPKIFILMTEGPNDGRLSGTLKVEFTAYQISRGVREPYRVVPLKTDNVVDSLQGFVTIANTFCRNPSVLHIAKSDMSSNDGKSCILQNAVDRIESDSKEREALINRIEELQRAIKAKRAQPNV